MGTQKENDKVEKAIVEGLEETKKEEMPEQDTLEELMKMVDFTLSKEVADGMRGIFDGTGIYNFPKFSATGEKIHPECDLMKGGCPMKGKQPHIHVIGIGIQGTLRATRIYGKMKIKNARPEIANNDGKKYWVAHSEIIDGHNGNELDLWYHEPVIKKFGDKLVENESAPQIAQSKCMRNAILAIIPGDLAEKWVEDYKAGKKPFSAERVKEHEQKQKAQRATKATTEPPPATEFGSESAPDNAELDNMTILNDWLSFVEKCPDMPALEAWYGENRIRINGEKGKSPGHPAKKQINAAVAEKKGEFEKKMLSDLIDHSTSNLNTDTNNGQETLFPELPKE